VSDEPYTPFAGRRVEPEKPILIDRVWRVRHSRSGRVLSCGLYQHPVGIEVRCGYQEEDNLLRSMVERLPDGAWARAAEWKQMVIDKGYEEVDVC
jgi:hypothetical protein